MKRQIFDIEEETKPRKFFPIDDSIRQIGSEILGARIRRNEKLKDAAKKIGISSAVLSNLESGTFIPTLPVLTKIGGYFHLDLEKIHNLYVNYKVSKVRRKYSVLGNFEQKE